MSDFSDGSGQISRRPRVSDGPTPVSGVVAIVLAVIAVVAGYLILRSITDGGSDTGALNPGGGVETPGGVTNTTDPADISSTVPTLAPEPTEPPGLVIDGATVIVANANGRGGSAGQASLILENSAGFTVLPTPTKASSSMQAIDASVIYYVDGDAAAQTVANSLNVVMGGGLNVQALPDPAPITDGDMKGATVLLMLGVDFSEMTPGDLDLEAIAGGTSSAPATNPSTDSTSPSSTTAPAG